MKRRRKPFDLQKWNTEIPPGSAVTLKLDDGQLLATRTRSEAWLLGDGSPVVLVEGKTGGWHVERVALARVAGATR